MINIFSKTATEHAWSAAVTGLLGMIFGVIGVFGGVLWASGLSLGFGIVTIFHCVRAYMKSRY